MRVGMNVKGVGMRLGVPPPLGKEELHDLCAQGAARLHWCFRVIHATSPTVKLATRVSGAHEAQGGLMGQAWLLWVGQIVPCRHSNPGVPSRKISIYRQHPICAWWLVPQKWEP